MTESASSSPPHHASAYFKPEAMGPMLRLVLSDRSAAAVMLAIWSYMEESGTVRVTQAAIAQECDITLRRLSKDIAYLAEANWITLVEVSIEPGGPLVCVINASFFHVVMEPAKRV